MFLLWLLMAPPGMYLTHMYVLFSYYNLFQIFDSVTLGSLYIFSSSGSRVYYACIFWNNSLVSDYSLVLFTSWFGSSLLLPPPLPLHYILLYAWAQSGLSLAFFRPSWQLLLPVSTSQHKINHVLRKLMYLCELSTQESLIVQVSCDLKLSTF